LYKIPIYLAVAGSNPGHGASDDCSQSRFCGAPR